MWYEGDWKGRKEVRWKDIKEMVAGIAVWTSVCVCGSIIVIAKWCVSHLLPASGRCYAVPVNLFLALFSLSVFLSSLACLSKKVAET